MKRRSFLTLSACAAAGATANACNPLLPFPTSPVNDAYDVIVCGGGPAGISAALAAQRSGASTLLIESNGCLGGTWTAGLLPVILDYENKGGILKEIIAFHPTYLSRLGWKLLVETDLEYTSYICNS